MHFITFPVASTTIFPLSNSTKGGQLVTEYNLKSRDMVATNPDIKYPVGPSYLHSLDDFKVKLLEDSDVEEYDNSKYYLKGDYCRYNNDTYICTTKTAGIDKFIGNDSVVMFVLTQTVDSVNSVTVDGLAVTDYDVDASHNAIVFTTAPAADVDIVVDYELSLPLLHTIPFDSECWAKSSISHSIIQVDPGRAVINGHYVESLAPMTVDLQLANAELKRNSQAALFGNLSIGIKTYFSTSNTMSGAMLVENTDNMYVGVQLVVMKTSEFKTPEDCPNDQNAVTADIKLADFTYVNGSISESSIVPNANATRYIPSERIYDFDSILDDKYVTSENLVDRMFYTYSGKSGWCDSTDNLMVWDADSEHRQTTTPPSVQEAVFLRDPITGEVHFVIPHKQQDAVILNDNDERVYYADRDLKFPTANYSTGASGIVTNEYTQHIKDIAAVINTYKQFTNGKQIMYIDILTVNSDGEYSYEFPKDLSNFNVGDYILVREDYTATLSEDDGAAPSTMYFVLPGGVVAVASSGMTTTCPPGVRLGNPQVLWAGDGSQDPGTNPPTDEELLDMFGYTTYKGTTSDYFEIDWHNVEDTLVKKYYFPVSATGPKTWSEAVKLTGGIPLATENQVGGFYNAPNDTAYADAGYVYLDETGHLKLMDYGLLRSGTLAYQLGSDFRVPSNQTLEYIQAYLNESVNDRVAFRTNRVPTTTPDMIHVYIPLPEEEGTLNIYDLDSRFGTGVYIHFLIDDKSKDYSGIVVNISDCEKIRIDSSITALANGPVINIFRSCLYYDAEVINYIRLCDSSNVRASLPITDFTGFDNLTLWYARFVDSDPDLIVNGMEISQPNVAMITQDIAFWDDTISDDNHYSYALRSITLSGSGKMIGCSLYVSNNSTQTVNTTQHIIIGGDFIIPQGSALNYPTACVNSPIKVTGTFTTAYRATNTADWIVTGTSFTAMSGIYSVSEGMGTGSIAFDSSTSLIPATYTNVDRIGGWEPGSYHIFYGGTTV